MAAQLVDIATPPVGVPDTVRFWLRLEGAAAFVAGAALFGSIGGQWLWFVPLLLVPDASMIGYAAGRRVGAFTYNLVHNWALALVLIGAGIGFALPGLTIAGAVVVAHVGMDRLVGYGLKHPESFRDTHLQRA